ncbi:MULTISPECIES: ABC transporter substrate-binding protein [unclassified Pseudodesulfovibrio]|uniref:ABC transporter substrate-binding protein n=1 Tax=unclassified Pseudodesulfovibrio TaxID=2661612 RepID=UPI000FEBC88C|nr:MULTISPECIES: ABC transporter substrate-binding protein [unclassified Pseudodesulfovibrio]MCJ2164262.1 ABC transporter substrate-binding protein [Pseudodesulfovibrio sp. S3-i]RWU05116.1 ABC transporter substrate-binding protein [Pseudodesulfovibrio sp. S3]
MKKILFAVVVTLIFSVSAHAESHAVRFGILPVIDTLPLQVAVKDGLFAKHGLDVELVGFMSALERDTAMQTGRIDGYFGDLIATYMLIHQGVPMRIALTSWRTTPGYPMFGIALSPANKDRDLGDMKGRSLALSKSTVMEFLADKMEDHLGVNRGHFSQVEIKKMPIRLQMLMTDQVDSALLPEPLLSLARLKGGGLLATAEDLDLPLTVLCLHENYFKNDGDAYRRFIAAYREAVQRLSDAPEDYRQLMAETCRIPKPLVSEFPVYPFPAPALPTTAELDEVQAWMLEKGLLKTKVAHETALSPIIP